MLDNTNRPEGQVYDEAQRFLTRLDPEAEGFTFQTFDDNGERKDPALVRVLHGTLAQHWDELVDLNNRGAGIYVTANETDGSGRSTENIVRVRVLFVDLDGAPLEPVLSINMKPHIVVNTSPGKWHTYWLISGLELIEFSDIQQGLANRFDGDPAVHDLPRVMRLPGFFHRKAEPFLVRIHSVADDCTPYPAEHFRLSEEDKMVLGLKHGPKVAGNDLTSIALKNMEAWVPAIFGDKARPSRRGGYRVSSRNLDRFPRLKEDLALHPDGIVDFGVHDMGDERDGCRLPVDIVVEWGPRFGVAIGSEAAAEFWLRTKLGLPTNIITATPYVWIDPSTLPLRQWLYRPHYIRQFLSTIFATSGVGKSSVVIVEALAMASGKSLLGVLPEKPLGVWYWNGEDPNDELQRCIGAANKHYQLTAEHIGDRLFVDSGRTMPIVIAEDTRTGTRVYEPVIEQVVATLLANCIDVLIIDPFVSCHHVSENDNSAIDRVAKSWSHIAELANCSVMLVHHTRKTNGEAVSIEDGRGASALKDAARSIRTINTMTSKEAEQAEIEESRRRFFIRADLGKSKMTRPAERADWFWLASVNLGNGPVSEDPSVAQFSNTSGDEVGVVTAWRYPTEIRATATVEDVLRVQQMMENGGSWRYDAKSTREPWIGIVIAQVLGLDLTRKPVRTKVTESIGEWVAKGWLAIEERRGPDRKEHSYVTVGLVRPGASDPPL